MRFETAYDAKRREFTPAMPINGLAMPEGKRFKAIQLHTSPYQRTFVKRKEPLSSDRLNKNIYRTFLRERQREV